MKPNKPVIVTLMFLMLVTLLSGQVFGETQIPVSVIEPGVKSIRVEESVTGVIKPYQVVNLSTKTGGIVDEILVEVGQRVEAGEPLLKLEQEELKAQVKQARAQLAMARASFKKIKDGASPEDVEKVRGAYNQALASYNGARKALNIIKDMYEDKTSQEQQLTAARTKLDTASKKLELAREQLKQTEVSYEQAEKSYKRMEYLYEEGVITESEFDKVKTQYENAKSALKSAELGLEQAKVNYEGALKGYNLVKEIYENPRSLEQQLLNAETQYEVAKANLQIAKANLDQVLMGAEEEDLQSARAQVEQAEVALELANIRLRDSVLESPFPGLIAAVNINEGEMAPPGNPVIKVVNLDKVYAEIEVSASTVTSLETGDLVRVEILPLANMSMTGKIETIAPDVDPRSRAYPVKVVIPNSKNMIKGGMYCRVYLTLKESNRGVVVPVDSVLDLEEKPYIFVVNNGKAEKRFIETGLINDTEVQVIDGLNPDERVVVKGQYKLTDGAPVKVVN
ncbi:efflux RND transporter periplasmic adaptor subunit [Halothermothrix orenii]|uniref:Efflux transporter, RND family, MFP subunit n=1 Tax=Halothermothrix orenii (strain H 168 / OCM 544 / DSM 9562) TaxID=373903 RepID=B8D235_HALOH|nr:efflux RND transporter periplasmic adaptor subunit [Halothermothrix orenii]ACL69262.1 efflux transporter, RND family, MFP subunit [Halothermothrix orenii H 168]